MSVYKIGGNFELGTKIQFENAFMICDDIGKISIGFYPEGERIIKFADGFMYERHVREVLESKKLGKTGVTSYLNKLRRLSHEVTLEELKEMEMQKEGVKKGGYYIIRDGKKEYLHRGSQRLGQTIGSTIKDIVDKCAYPKDGEIQAVQGEIVNVNDPTDMNLQKEIMELKDIIDGMLDGAREEIEYLLQISKWIKESMDKRRAVSSEVPNYGGKNYEKE